ncbi:hypothetical protein [Roseobacter cerasinus]|nr:hypothetical protein [Roseobacter cerasinus]
MTDLSMVTYLRIKEYLLIFIRLYARRAVRSGIHDLKASEATLMTVVSSQAVDVRRKRKLTAKNKNNARKIAVSQVAANPLFSI